MLLGFAREDLEMRTLDELWINGQPSDPAQLYYPIGGDRYRNLGLEVDCDNFAGSRSWSTISQLIATRKKKPR